MRRLFAAAAMVAWIAVVTGTTIDRQTAVAASHVAWPIAGSLSTADGCAQVQLKVFSMAAGVGGYIVTWGIGDLRDARGLVGMPFANENPTLTFRLTDGNGNVLSTSVHDQSHAMSGPELGTGTVSPGADTLSLTLTVAHGGTSCTSGPSTLSIVAPVETTPLDGLILRLTGPMRSNGGGTVFGCAVSGTVALRVVTTTIRTSPGGWAASRTQSVPKFFSGASADMLYGPDGVTPVGTSGHVLVDRDGKYLKMEMDDSFNTFANGCAALPKIGSSAAGDVYAMKWTACDAGCVPTSPSSPPVVPAEGTGCVAVDTANGVLTLTAQLGICTPEAFPAISSSSTSDVKPTSKSNRTKKLPLCKKHQRSTRARPCRKR